MVRGRHRALPALHADAVVRGRLDVSQAAWTRTTSALSFSPARLGFWSWSRTSAAVVMAPILQGSRVMRSRAFPVRLRRALARSARGRAPAVRELRSVLPWGCPSLARTDLSRQDPTPTERHTPSRQRCFRQPQPPRCLPLVRNLTALKQRCRTEVRSVVETCGRLSAWWPVPNARERTAASRPRRWGPGRRCTNPPDCRRTKRVNRHERSSAPRRLCRPHLDRSCGCGYGPDCLRLGSCPAAADPHRRQGSSPRPCGRQ